MEVFVFSLLGNTWIVRVVNELLILKASVITNCLEGEMRVTPTIAPGLTVRRATCLILINIRSFVYSFFLVLQRKCIELKGYVLPCSITFVFINLPHKVNRNKNKLCLSIRGKSLYQSSVICIEWW